MAGAGLALEPQLFPDTPNRPEFGSAVLRPEEPYSARLKWRFVAIDEPIDGLREETRDTDAG